MNKRFILSFLLFPNIVLSQESILINNQVLLKIYADTMIVGEGGILEVPLTIIRSSSNNILFVKEKNKNNDKTIINFKKSPLRYKISYAKKDSAYTPFMQPNMFRKLVYFIKYGYKMGARVDRIKTRGSSMKLKSIVLEKDTTIILISINLHELFEYKNKNLIPTHLQFLYSIFPYKGQLCYDIISSAPYAVMERVRKSQTNTNRFIVGSYASNKVVLKSWQDAK